MYVFLHTTAAKHGTLPLTKMVSSPVQGTFPAERLIFPDVYKRQSPDLSNFNQSVKSGNRIILNLKKIQTINTRGYVLSLIHI